MAAGRCSAGGGGAEAGAGSWQSEAGGEEWSWGGVAAELETRPLFRRLVGGGDGTERRRLEGGGLVCLLRTAEGSRAALLRLPDKLLYLDKTPRSAFLLQASPAGIRRLAYSL